MIYFTQLIFIKPGREGTFAAFEDHVLPLLARYEGRLLYRVRPAADAMLHSELGQPYEVHLVSFPGESNFQGYMNDAERQRYLDLKNDSVERVLLIQGTSP